MTHDNTDETFTRTSPPLNRFTVKLGGPAPWEVLTASNARNIADHVSDQDMYGIEFRVAAILRTYADAVDAMTPSRPERDMQTTDEELFF